MIHFTLYLLLFLFGLIIGSFLNSVIFRLEKGESVIKSKIKKQKSKIARSYCPHCQHKLSWLDLIPVFSFIFLCGKCRYCRKAISWQYPIVEISTALIFIGIINFQLPISKQFSITNFQTIFNLGFWHLNFYWILDIGFWIFIVCSLIIIFIYDLRHYIIPDKILFPAILITFLWLVFSSLEISHWSLIGNWKLEIGNLNGLYRYFLSALLASGFFLLIVLLSSGRAMGLGDAKLAFLMGLLLGWPNILVALFLAFFFGAVVGLALIILPRELFSGNPENSSLGLKKKNYTLKSQIPFAPFLIVGTFLALFWGGQIINWYSKIFI